MLPVRFLKARLDTFRIAFARGFDFYLREVVYALSMTGFSRCGVADRCRLIDVARGVSIFLVALNHSELGRSVDSVNSAISVFRMPFFFFVSGVLFSPRNGFFEFFVGKAESLLKPYFVVVVSVVLIGFAMSGTWNGWKLYGVIYAAPPLVPWVSLWFLPHLFLVLICFYFVFRIFEYFSVSGFVRAVFAFFAVVLGGFSFELYRGREFVFFDLCCEWQWLPFAADLLPVTLGFFLFGNVFQGVVRKFEFSFPVFLFSVLLFVFCVYHGANVNLAKKVFWPPFVGFLGAFSGVFITLGVSSLIVRFGRRLFLDVFAASAIFILIFQGPVEHFAFRSAAPVLGAPLAGVFSFTFSLFLSVFLHRFALVFRPAAWVFLPSARR